MKSAEPPKLEPDPTPQGRICFKAHSGGKCRYGLPFFGDTFNMFFNYVSDGALAEFVGGNDTLSGGDGADRLYGEAHGVSYHSASWQSGIGDEVLICGDDVLMGGAGADALIGDVQTIILHNGYSTVLSGDDVLMDGTGNDSLYGDSINTYGLAGYQTGADTFVFEANSGADTIYDFEVGKDHIDVSALGYTNFADVSALFTWDAGTGDLIIDWDGAGTYVDQVTLLGNTSLTADNFVFA